MNFQARQGDSVVESKVIIRLVLTCRFDVRFVVAGGILQSRWAIKVKVTTKTVTE